MQGVAPAAPAPSCATQAAAAAVPACPQDNTMLATPSLPHPAPLSPHPRLPTHLQKASSAPRSPRGAQRALRSCLPGVDLVQHLLGDLQTKHSCPEPWIGSRACIEQRPDTCACVHTHTCAHTHTCTQAHRDTSMCTHTRTQAGRLSASSSCPGCLQGAERPSEDPSQPWTLVSRRAHQSRVQASYSAYGPVCGGGGSQEEYKPL